MLYIISNRAVRKQIRISENQNVHRVVRYAHRLFY